MWTSSVLHGCWSGGGWRYWADAPAYRLTLAHMARLFVHLEQHDARVRWAAVDAGGGRGRVSTAGPAAEEAAAAAATAVERGEREEEAAELPAIGFMVLSLETLQRVLARGDAEEGGGGCKVRPNPNPNLSPDSSPSPNPNPNPNPNPARCVARTWRYAGCPSAGSVT